jgi:hypothetical protein
MEGKRVQVDENTKCKICGNYAAVPFADSKLRIVTEKPTHGECYNENCGE